MDGELILILLGIAAAGLVFLIAKLVSSFRAFTDAARYICHEMDRADCYEEYRRWRGELRCHYLTLIPFVNDKNVMGVYRFIFHRGEPSDNGERKDGIGALLMPSILGVCCCLVCICGMTWAWFSASVQSSPQKMTAAYYDVTVDSVMHGDSPVEATDGGYSLTSDETYTVRLTASGTVVECGGYCLIQNTADDTKTYTQTFKPGESITVQFTPTADGSYTFTGVWGSISPEVPDENIITGSVANNSVTALDAPGTSDIENVMSDTPGDTTEAPFPVTDPVAGPDTVPVAPPAPAPVDTSAETEPIVTYTVQKKDTLSAIALKYGVSVEALAEYNGILDPDFIVTGQSIKIPPADRKAPADAPDVSEQTQRQ